MGYTNYLRLNVPSKGIRELEEQYQIAIKQMNKLIRAYQSEIKSIDEKHPARLSGYSAYTSTKSYGGIKINGTQDLSHEDFILREHLKENDSFSFCKTSRKPYDLVVKSCLLLLKHYLPDQVQVSCDGDSDDFKGSIDLIRRYIGINVAKNAAFNLLKD
jgi:hypothetical protein